MIPEAANLVRKLPEPLREAFATCYEFLVDDNGCNVYVKTIYVGFAIGEEMVCAIYPLQDHLEVAMALPEEVEGPEFKDATHLTWPTMPVAVDIRNVEDTNLAISHLSGAVHRVATGVHDVRRPNEHFQGRQHRGGWPKAAEGPA